MRIRTIETPPLGDRSYLVIAGGEAAVIDPQRDIDRVEALLAELDVRLTHVFETHVHNDYVSGGLELSRRHDATYVLPEGAPAEFACTYAKEGEAFAIGSARVLVLHTPGHTPEHVAYAVADGDEPTRAVFTGGSMLFGTVGRTDLLGSAWTDELTRLQFRSVHRLGSALPPEAGVYPTHGFGSFCASSPPSDTEQSTIGQERISNLAFRCSDETAFARELLAGPRDRPRYYDRMAGINLAGPAPIDLSPVDAITAESVAARIADGEAVVDLRSRADYADAHLRGTLSIEGGDQFATYLGWLVPVGDPVSVLAESAEEVERAQRDAARVGFDRLAGALIGEPKEWAPAGALHSYERATFDDLAGRLHDASPIVLDVRREDEWDASHVRDALHIPLHELQDRINEVPDDEIWVHCGSGFRASIAASILDTPTRTVVLIDDDWSAAQKHSRIPLVGDEV